ncbi:hypothetical protein [Streptomyces erythrochromogenes]|uniref:hypothetical protein n=1 Tax=Streptomyces erythrochromogenes TaxID=285574 RepID=UPI0036835367
MEEQERDPPRSNQDAGPMAETPSPIQTVSFAAWRDGIPHSGRPSERRYVTLAELLVRLGSHGLGMSWKARIFDEEPHPAFAQVLKASADTGIPTLELLAMKAPHMQAVDADFDGYAGGELVLTLREFDSSSWDVRTADTWVLSEIQRHYPDARPMTPEEWNSTN